MSIKYIVKDIIIALFIGQQSQGLLSVCFLLCFLFSVNFDFLFDFGLSSADFAEDMQKNHNTNVNEGNNEYSFGLNGESCIVFGKVFQTGTLL